MFYTPNASHRPIESRFVNKDWLRALSRTASIENNPSRLLADEFDEISFERREALALISKRESFTFSELEARSNRYARWALEQNLQKGDAVGLMMENRSEYIAIWLGLNRVGVVVALMNTNLAHESIARCMAISKARCLILSDVYWEIGMAVLKHTDPGAKIFVHGEGGNHVLPRIDLEVARLPGEPLADREKCVMTLSDSALYIFTSGTTGYPKATIVSHRRVLNWALWFSGLMDASPRDRIYNCLPLYHSVGGVVAVWAVLLAGGSVVIRERFSASSFWPDIVAWECTLFQYIGELCRYLVHTPFCPEERRHRLRLCVGNGLRRDVWTMFEQRFSIPRILEFYAATESNFSLYNVEGEPGAIGRIPPFVTQRLSVEIVKFDFEREEPLRGGDGYCIACKPDEVGEAIAKIEARAQDGSLNFEGYLDGSASEKKILRNVFGPGDAFMRSGDLMRKDARGFYFFIDRVGDSFRWKGENVATSEVAHVLSDFPGIVDATVYGVEIKGHDGRAGMAAISVDDRFDLILFKRHLAERLPEYAQPIFLRICESLYVTETFKHKKSLLMAQGFDPGKTVDRIFFAEPSRREYVRLNEAMYQAILSGAYKL
ncbi:MAG TPA: long-chain-acyl-CoA synthetase [Methylocella sp.]|nr:long-chain-acyl-CoA synthetase [Methylocella sp.]